MTDDLKKALETNLEATRAYVRDFLEGKFGPIGPSRGLVLSIDRAEGIVTIAIGPDEAIKAEVNRFVSIDWETSQ